MYWTLKVYCGNPPPSFAYYEKLLFVEKKLFQGRWREKESYRVNLQIWRWFNQKAGDVALREGLIPCLWFKGRFVNYFFLNDDNYEKVDEDLVTQTAYEISN